MLQNVVHIGYPKTGSSFLQKNVFPNLSEYHNIKFTLSKEIGNYLMHSGIFFDEYKYPVLNNNTHKSTIMSYEGLTGNQVSGVGVNAATTPVRLKKMGFTKVIITLRRNKDRWRKSMYNQYVKMGGRLTYNDFIQNPLRINNEYQIYHPDMIDRCEEYCNYYKDIFGEANVLTLYLEDLKSDYENYIECLSTFLNTEVIPSSNSPMNESLKKWQIKLLLFTNNFTSSRLAPSSYFSFFSTSKIIKGIQLLSSKSIRKS